MLPEDVWSYVAWLVTCKRIEMEANNDDDLGGIMGIHSDMTETDEDDWNIVAIIISFVYGDEWFDDDDNW